MMVLHTFNQRTLKVRGAVFLFLETKLLLLRQNNKPFYVLPGGTLEENESTADCAVREIKEELDINIALGPLVAISEFTDAKRHVMDVAFLSSYIAGPVVWTPPHPENIDEIVWLSKDQLNNVEIKPASIHTFLKTHWDTLEQGKIPLTNPYIGHECV